MQFIKLTEITNLTNDETRTIILNKSEIEYVSKTFINEFSILQSKNNGVIYIKLPFEELEQLLIKE